MSSPLHFLLGVAVAGLGLALWVNSVTACILAAGAVFVFAYGAFSLEG